MGSKWSGGKAARLSLIRLRQSWMPRSPAPGLTLPLPPAAEPG
jgi:hypothetical protein